MELLQSFSCTGKKGRLTWAFLVAQLVENLPTMWETWVGSLGWEIPWRRKWQPTPVLLPGEFHGRSLVGYSPWGNKESDTTERLHWVTSLLDLPGVSDGKASVYNVRDLGWIPGLGDSLEKEMATHSSTLALKIPWTEELGAGYYPWGRKESGTTERLHCTQRKWITI